MKGSTVDEEIRHPPVELGRLSYYLQGFQHIPGVWPWDFLKPSTSVVLGCPDGA